MPFGKIDVSCSGGAGDEAGREKELGHRGDEMLEHGLFPFPPGPLRTLSIGERQTSESRASPGGHPPGGALDDAQRDRAEIEQRSGDRRVCLPAVGAAGHDVELLDIEREVSYFFATIQKSTVPFTDVATQEPPSAVETHASFTGVPSL